MKDLVHFEPIRPETYQSYIEVGTKAYNQHYLHLWPNANSSPYIQSSFTEEVLLKEEKNNNTILYRIIRKGTPVGILKITLNATCGSYNEKEALYIDKIYLLNEYSRMGIGKKALQFVVLRAKAMGKKLVWLDTMQKGPAKEFYLNNGFEILTASKAPLPTILHSESAMWVMTKKV